MDYKSWVTTEADDLEVCKLQLFSLEQSRGILNTDFMPKYGQK